MAHDPRPSPDRTAQDVTAEDQQEQQEYPNTVYLRIRPSDSGINSLRHNGIGEQRYDIVRRINNSFQDHLQARAMADAHPQGEKGHEKYLEAAQRTLEEHKALFDLQEYVERRDGGQ